MKVLLKMILQFGIILALLVLGICETGSKKNLLTVIAILGCLPASKTMVEFIMLIPHRTVTRQIVTEIDECANLLTRVYDMVFTSEKKIMPVEAIVISGNTICGYTSNKKADVNLIAQHLKQYLYANKYDKVSVKIFEQYSAFISRAEGMNNIADVEKNDTKRQEEGIRQVLLNISL